MKWSRNSSFCSLNWIKPIIMSPHSERHHSLYYPTINYSQQEYLKLELPILRWMYATKAKNFYNKFKCARSTRVLVWRGSDVTLWNWVNSPHISIGTIRHFLCLDDGYFSILNCELITKCSARVKPLLG